MPSFDLDENQSAYQIRGYQPGTIQVNEKIFTQSLIVTPDKLIENWQPQTIEQLVKENFSEIINLKPDIVLLGTGGKLILLSPALYGELINLGIGVEVMDTSAACRTFNALSAENRNVAAALIIN